MLLPPLLAPAEAELTGPLLEIGTGAKGTSEGASATTVMASLRDCSAY